MFAGQILQQLVKLLTASFNENSLIIFVRTQLEADLHKDFVGKNQPLTDQIAQLIAKLDEGGACCYSSINSSNHAQTSRRIPMQRVFSMPPA
jgi:hypothetical protein